MLWSSGIWPGNWRPFNFDRGPMWVRPPSSKFPTVTGRWTGHRVHLGPATQLQRTRILNGRQLRRWKHEDRRGKISERRTSSPACLFSAWCQRFRWDKVSSCRLPLCYDTCSEFNHSELTYCNGVNAKAYEWKMISVIMSILKDVETNVNVSLF